MIKPFIFIASLLLLMIFSMATHALLFPYKSNLDAMQTVVRLTQLSSLSLSVAYDEHTFNTTYPEMPRLKRMDFIYDK